jgi:glyoxylase-like metal-dependent hydrolase (beta-lactamase superfamily II)
MDRSIGEEAPRFSDSSSCRWRNTAINERPEGPGEPVDSAGIVRRFLAPNPGPKTLQGTNTYVVGREQVYVIDPGPDDRRHLTNIVDWLSTTGRTALGILLTHGHPDHALGAAPLSELLRVPIWAAATEPYPPYAAPDHLLLAAESDLRVDTDTVRVIPTPGHSPDSVSYFLTSSGILFTGDTILGQGSSVIAPPEGDMASYMASLDLLQGLQSTLLAPGHGPVVRDVPAKLREYIEHRHARESQLINALAAGPSTVPALVARSYVDTPPELRQLAEGTVTAGLQKLEREGLVQQGGDFWSLRRSNRP